MDMMCCKCKKRPAMLFVAKFDGKEMINEGYCLKCASELGLPQVKSMMDSMGITQEDLDKLDEQLDSFGDLGSEMFEPGGAETMPTLFQKLFGGSGGNEEESESGLTPYTAEPAELRAFVCFAIAHLPLMFI